MEKPTRNASALTVRLLLPLSRIKNTSADPRLAMMRINAMATKIFMKDVAEVKISSILDAETL